MPDKSGVNKDELLRLLSDVEPQAARLETLGQEIVRSARLSRDVAAPIRYLVSELPAESLEGARWDRLAETWRSWHRVAGDLVESSTMVNSFGAVSLIATSSGSETFATLPVTTPLSPRAQAVIQDAHSQLSLALARFPLAEEARSSLRRLGLDVRGGSYRAPLQLLDEAMGALERPVVQAGGPVSVLIPLRECINSAISELIRRRPNQEPASKLGDKLASLARQCTRPGLGSGHVERLAADGEPLLDTLSMAKQADMSREQQTELFNRGLAFLNALISSVDETRLRPP